ncbi:MAG: alcohol dehydrogenase catalytic domain-containing protein [Aquamicrobium sp.]|uniref:zinc-binding dehydrogenase n=1 Tax=Aquamicrobium sp. TaxID=1872579 RepID=UPI00349EDE2B|nr:alcohol dehydrogenase catalytic domain-containing protein [Aquamicrobium sp.]
MGTTMKAVRCFGFGRQHRFVADAPVPVPGPGEVLVRVDASGICATDRAMWDGSGPWRLAFPFTPGHEFTGTVVELGEGAGELHGLALGQRAVAELNVTRGNDFFRQRGLYHLSDAPEVIGVTRDGGWAEYMIYPANAVVHKVPDAVSDKAACYAEPLANAIHSVERAGIGFGDVVVVSGAGPLGLGMLQAARLRTPRKLILVNPGAAKRALGLRLGADLVFHPDDPALKAAVADLTGGRGADVFLEASGHTEAFQAGLDLIRKRGTIVVSGVYRRKAEIDLNALGEFKELNILGSRLAPFTYAVALDLMARGLIDGEACVTQVYPLEAFEEALDRQPIPGVLQVKVIFDPRL